jgi:hypothetical protein
MDDVTTECVNCQTIVSLAVPDDVRNEDGEILVSQEGVPAVMDTVGEFFSG